jgi:hypothetical protein
VIYDRTIASARTGSAREKHPNTVILPIKKAFRFVPERLARVIEKPLPNLVVSDWLWPSSVEQPEIVIANKEMDASEISNRILADTSGLTSGD